ncbi:TPA: aminoacyltransferase [Streptococcus suis]|uniref:peptidoglycan bridge formation glycyltransferase FemA/FemB family protein n=1 Tax=Streptococcus suis TaxID=1307 RepID=UPI0014783239|nr:aminoacyltransferase [Streptococcus suis]
MQLIELTLADFQKHAKQVAQRSFMQTEEMAELLRRRGMDVRFIGLTNQDQILVSAVIYAIPMTGGLHLEINSGPVCQDPAHLRHFYRLLKTYAKERGALQVLVKPYDSYQTFDSDGKATGPEQPDRIKDLTDNGFLHDGLLTGYPGGEPDWHYVKDLSTLTQDSLFASFSKKGKTLVKKTNSFGLTIRELDRDQLERFKAITSATSERREYPDKSLDYYQDFFDAFGEKAAFTMASINFRVYLKHLEDSQKQVQQKLDAVQEELDKNSNSRKKQNEHRELTSQVMSFETRKEEALKWIDQYGEADIDLAASLFVYTDHELVYLFSGSLTEFNAFYAPVALQEFAMRKALDKNIPFYNLLGIRGEFDGSDGVLRFKQNFNGTIVRKMGTFRYYPHPIKYKLIRSLKTILGRK